MRVSGPAVAGLVAAIAAGAPAFAQMPTPLPAEVLREASDPAKVAYLNRHVVAQGPSPAGSPFPSRPRSFVSGSI